LILKKFGSIRPNPSFFFVDAIQKKTVLIPGVGALESLQFAVI